MEKILEDLIKRKATVNICLKGRWYTGRLVINNYYYQLILADRIIPFLLVDITRPVEEVKNYE